MSPVHDAPGAILYVTATLPWPPTTGGHLRTAANLGALASLAPTHLVAFPADPGRGEVPLTLASVRVVPVPPPAFAMRVAYRLASTIGRSHPYLERFRRRGGLEALRGMVDELRPSVVVLEYPFYPSIAIALAAFGRAFIADVADDRIALARQTAAHAASPRARLRSLLDLPPLLASERRLGVLDQVWFAGAPDAARARRRFPRLDVRVVPNVVDAERLAAEHRPDPIPRSVAFLGSFDYPPNEVAALRFARGIAPRLRSQVPGARFGLIGRRPTPAVRAVADDGLVTLHADVPDAAQVLARYQVMVAPLSMGSGTRLKILEALAAGIPVVSTRVGMAGLELVVGREILVADDDAGIAEAVRSIWASADLAQSLSAAGREAVLTRYGHAALGRIVHASLGALSDRTVMSPPKPDPFRPR